MFKKLFALGLSVSMILAMSIVANAEGDVEINDTNFEDDIFRSFVSNRYDKDGDGVLSSSEIKAVTSMTYAHYEDDEDESGDPINANTKSLKGIEFFTELIYLDCSNCDLQALDVSSNTKLDYLVCDNNPIKSLNIDSCGKLVRLSCSNCALQTLNLDDNNSLEELTCSNNDIESLNLRNNTKLQYLNCSYNKIQTLDLSENDTIYDLVCNNNLLNELILSDDSSFNYIKCHCNNLDEIDITGQSSLIKAYMTYDPVIVDGTVSYGEGLKIDVGTKIGIDGMDQIVPVVIDKDSFPDPGFRQYISEEFDTNHDGSLSATEIYSVTQVFLIDKENITDLTGIELFPNLEDINCERLNLTQLDVSKVANLNCLYCGGNPLKSIDLSKNKKLEYFDCYSTGITELNLSNNKKLIELGVYDCKIDSLDLRSNPALCRVTCTNSSVSTINISNCPVLIDLFNGIECYGPVGSPAWFDYEEGTRIITGIKHKVNCSNCDNGSVNVSHNTACAWDEVTVTATPDDGYALDKITVTDSEGVTIAVIKGKFTMPEGDVTVSAIFKELPPAYELTIDCNPEEAVVSGITASTTAYEGDEYSFTITAQKGYKVTAVYANYTELAGADNVYSAIQPAGNLVIRIVCEVCEEPEPVKNGWVVDDDGNKYYYQDDVMLTGWQTIKSAKYYFDTTSGVMATSWKTIKGKKYYFNKTSGKMTIGWKTISSKKYYFSTKGVMTTDAKKIDGKYYLFSTKGVMQKSGWKKDSKGNTYCLNSKGVAATKKWKKKSGKSYYFGSDGKMVKGKSLKIGKKTYKFKSNGVCNNR